MRFNKINTKDTETEMKLTSEFSSFWIESMDFIRLVSYARMTLDKFKTKSVKFQNYALRVEETHGIPVKAELIYDGLKNERIVGVFISEQFICRDCEKPSKEYRDQLCEPCHKWHTDS